MAKIIEARVIQKIDTEQNWNANELILYKGEIALVGDPDRVYNIKVGNGFKKFRDLPYMVDYVNGLYTGVITPQSQVPSGVNNVFLVSDQGTYTNFGNVVLPKDNLGIIYKNGNNYTIQLIPIVSEEKLQKYIDEKLVNANIGFGGEITSLAQSPNVQGMYIPKVNGVYPNFGNLEYDSTDGLTLFLYKDNQFSKITIPLSGVENEVNFNNNTLSVSGNAVEKYAVKKINTISDLRSTNGEYEGQIVELLGYYESGDKEPLKYKWSTDQGVDDGGSIINSGNGSWEAIWGDKAWKSTKDFGLHSPDITNHTPYLQTMLDLGGRIFIDPSVIYKNSSIGGLKITQSNTEIAGLKGVSTIEQLGQYNISINSGSGGSANPEDNIKNVKIHDIVFKNNKGTFDEHNHSMNLNAFTNVEIYNCELIGFEGDGIYIGSSNVGGSTERHNFNLKIYNNVIDGVNGENRNAISIIDCKGAEIFNNSIKNCTKSTMPGAIDIEPNANAFHVCQDIKIYNNELYNIGGNAGVFCIYGGAGNYTNPIKNIHIYDNVVKFGSKSNGYGFNIVTQNRSLTINDIDSDIFISNNQFESGTISRPYIVTKCKGVVFQENIYRGVLHPIILGINNHDSKIFNIKSINESMIDSLVTQQSFRLFSYEDIEIKDFSVINSCSTHLIYLALNGEGKGLKVSGVKYIKGNSASTWFINKDASFIDKGDNFLGENKVSTLNSTTSCFSNIINKVVLANDNINPIAQQGDLLLHIDNGSIDTINSRLRVKTREGVNNSSWYDLVMVKFGSISSKPTNPYRGMLYNNTDNNTIEMWSGTKWLRMHEMLPTQPNSTAKTVDQVVTDLNTLIAKLKSAGLMNNI